MKTKLYITLVVGVGLAVALNFLPRQGNSDDMPEQHLPVANNHPLGSSEAAEAHTGAENVPTASSGLPDMPTTPAFGTLDIGATQTTAPAGIVKGRTLHSVAKPKTTQSQSDLVAQGSNKRLSTKERHRQIAINSTLNYFAGFFDSIQLTTEERTRIAEIVADRRLSVVDNARTTSDVKQRAAYFSAAVKQENAALAEIMGEEGVKAFRKYASDTMSMPVVQETIKRCTAQGIPVTPDMGKMLTQAISGKGIVGSMPSPVTAEQHRIYTGMDPQAIAAAAKVLTPQQLEVFKQAMAERFMVKN